MEQLTQEQKDIIQIEEMINAGVKAGICSNIQTAAIVAAAWERIKTAVLKKEEPKAKEK